MYCTNCGKQIKNGARFCPYCGYALSHNREGITSDKENINTGGSTLYHLPMTVNRPCDIQVCSDHITFSGKFWYLRDKDFYRNGNKSETALIKDFLGIGYLAKRSYRQTVLFVFGGTLLEIIKVIVDKVSEWVDNANNYLQWVNRSVALPGWINTTMNVIAFLCVVLGIILFFSKKKIVEISFTTKRICIPQKSLSADEFNKLHDIIKSLKEQL